LAAGRTGEELREGDKIGKGRFIEPAPAGNVFPTEVAEVCDRTPEGGQAQSERHAQDLETLIRAGALLADEPKISIVLVGFGARYQEYVRLTESCGASNVQFLPYQPREILPLSLSSCDVHFVGLGAGLAGYVVPSRLAGIMAAGRPVIAAAEEESETAQTVLAAECGRVIAPGDPASLAAAIRELSQASDLGDMGRNARTFAVDNLDRRIAIARYRALISEVLSQAS